MRDLGWSSVSLYGAGSFTRRALENFTDSPLHIASIADDNPALRGSTLAGIPLVSLEDAATNVDAIVLCSDGHEASLLRNTAALRSRGVIVVPISSYHPEFAHHHPLSPRATACAA
jgi:hypothetical protein